MSEKTVVFQLVMTRKISTETLNLSTNMQPMTGNKAGNGSLSRNNVLAKCMCKKMLKLFIS